MFSAQTAEQAALHSVHAALIISCKRVMTLICFLISALTQKGILRAAKWTTDPESAAMSATLPHGNNKYTFFSGDFEEKQKE